LAVNGFRQASAPAASAAGVGTPHLPEAATPSDTVVATASATQTPAPATAPPPTPPTLHELLHDPAMRHDTDAAFTVLFANWGLNYSEFEGGSACERAEQAQLVCYYGAGTWNNLRQLNRPAIVELIDRENNRHHVVVKTLRADRVVLGMNERDYEFATADVDRYWLGKYLLLWRPPYVEINNLRRGRRGPSVVWLRDALARYAGRAPQGQLSDMFDAELENHVKAFQRQHLLAADGIVGALTLMQLSVYDATLGSPLLSEATQTAIP
jgi:general secretion pathway protein A